MKAEIHPKYEEITATCSCGTVIKTRSTVCEDIHLEVCSNCHPFYTGKRQFVDTAGRVEKFNRRYRKVATDSTDEAETAEAKKAEGAE